MEPKPCASCKEFLPTDRFGKNRTKAGGLCGACLACARLAAKASYQRHRNQRQKDAKANYWKNPVARRQQATANKKKHPARYRFYYKRSKCREAGMPFDLTLADFISLHETLVCGACGVETEHVGRARRNSWSLDKMVPALGYVQGNVYVLCLRCNTIKNDGDIPALERVLSYMKKSLQTEALSDGAGI